MNAIAITVAVISLAGVQSMARAQNTDANQLPDALRLVPPDAPAALVVPNLKRASDDLTRLLEGMDRANIMLGSRPIDQFKSLTGFTTGLHDTGAMVVAITDPRAQPLRFVSLMPTSDAQTFLSANFTPPQREGDAYVRANGGKTFARVIGQHVALSADDASVRDFAVGEGSLDALKSKLSEMAGREMRLADAIIVIRQPMIAALKQRALAEAERTGARLPVIALLASRLADDIDTLVLTIQADPLGLIVRGVAVFRDDSHFAEHTAAIAAAATPDTGGNLILLPNKPLALALMIDLKALGGEQTLRAMVSAAGEADAKWPPWLALADSLQLAIGVGPAGARGGMLNDAALVLRGASADALRDAFKRDVLAAASDKPMRREAKWLGDQTLSEGAKADAWEVRTLDAPPEFAPAQAMEALLFGSAGMRGYASTLPPDALAITLSQRPALLAEIAGGAAAARVNPSAGLDGSSAVKVMRQWMPAQRDVEGYLGMGQVSTIVRDYARALNIANDALTLPEFDANLPPVGFALDVSPRRAMAMLIAPAGVLAPVFDQVVRNLPSLRPAPPAK